MQLASQILDYVRAQEDRLIEFLRQLVNAESPSDRPEMHHLTRLKLRTALEALAFDVREVGARDGPRHLYARPIDRQSGVARQLLVGHYDTVWPLGTLNKRPFSIDGNIVRGPGAFDMKGGLAQLVFAFEAIRNLGLTPPLEPVLFINGDEEIGSHSSTRYIRCLAKCVERAFVIEPAMGDDGRLKTERKGIGRFTITVFGKAAHAGLDPDGGVSAILELSHVIQKLFSLNDPDRGITVNVGTVDGGIQPNVIAPHSKAVVDVRVPTLATGKEIERAIHDIQATVPGVRLRIEGRIGRPSMEATPRNQALWQQAKTMGRELGLELEQARAGGGSDGNTTSQYTATLDGLGPVGDGAHAEREFLYIDKTLERTALLAVLIMSPPLDGRSTTEAGT